MLQTSFFSLLTGCRENQAKINRVMEHFYEYFDCFSSFMNEIEKQ